jgi:hypothetical protein
MSDWIGRLYVGVLIYTPVLLCTTLYYFALLFALPGVLYTIGGFETNEVNVLEI